MRSLLFWDFTQRRLVVGYRRFGTTYRFHLQGSSSPVSFYGITSYQSTLCKILEERRCHLKFRVRCGESTLYPIQSRRESVIQCLLFVSIPLGQVISKVLSDITEIEDTKLNMSEVSSYMWTDRWTWRNQYAFSATI